MPIGIINKHDYEREVNPNKDNNIPANNNFPARSVDIIIDKTKGRGNKSETPEEIRSLIAQESLLGTSSSQLSKEFNVSESSVSAYKKGATSTTTYNEGDKKLKNKNNIFRDRIVRRAGRLSISALDSISVDDFKNASLTDKANVAKQMASIVKDMSIVDNENDKLSNVQIVIHAPAMRSANDYIEGIVSVD